MQKSHIFLLAIIGLLVLILYLESGTQKDSTKYDNIYNTYQTDTTHTNKVYNRLIKRIDELETRLEETPPKEVRYYVTPNPENTIIEKVPDSLLVYIGELEEKLAISDKYIKNYPTADKLIDFGLTRDKFNITTLNTSGQTRESQTPLYLDEYNYYWDNNTLYHEKRENPYTYKDPNRWKQLYLNGGYDYFHSTPKLELEYSIKLNRFKLGTQASTLFHPTGALLYGDITLGYRLLK